MQPNYENLTNPLLGGNYTHGQNEFMAQSMRGPDTSLNCNNENHLNCYFDQHSGISSGNIVSSFASCRQNTNLNNSPGTMQT